MRIAEIPLNQIRRPLPRVNDQTKVAALMESIREVGLNEPIDVLEVEGQYYGFSGCHRYEACQRLGLETIRCNVRRAPRTVLQMHLAWASQQQFTTGFGSIAQTFLRYSIDNH